MQEYTILYLLNPDPGIAKQRLGKPDFFESLEFNDEV